MKQTDKKVTHKVLVIDDDGAREVEVEEVEAKLLYREPQQPLNEPVVPLEDVWRWDVRANKVTTLSGTDYPCHKCKRKIHEHGETDNTE